MLSLSLQLENYLPEEYQILVKLQESLPAGYIASAPPFLSLVVNVNIRTEAHRDVKDKNICMVIPIGDFQGGELVLVEQGLVLELGNGDVVVFRSAESTHFNLDYSGKRASFVLNTDSHMDSWEKNKNGWAGNDHYH